MKRRNKQSFSANKKMNFIRKVWMLMEPFHRQIYGLFALSFVFETIRMGSPFIFGKILDLLINARGSLSFDLGLKIIGTLAGLRVLSVILDYIIDITIVNMLWKTERYISTITFNKLLELSLDYHEKENTGTKINIVNKGRDKLIELLAVFEWEFQGSIVQLFVTAIIMVLVDWRIGLIFILSLTPFTLITIRTHKATSQLRSRRHDMYEVSSGEVGDTITNISVVKAYAQENREEKSFQSLWDIVKNLSVREYRKRTIANLGKSFFVELFYVILLLLGIVEVRYGSITVGSLVFLITLIERSYSHVYRLGRIYEQAVDSSESVDRIANLMARESSIKNSPNALKLENIEGRIGFDHVSFGYNQRKVLKDVSFTIPEGSFTALVGKSGGGKSTIAKLLSRYYDPTNGRILIDGKFDLKELDLDSYRRQTAVVFQDSPVPNRKIWEVISYAAGKRSFAGVKNDVIRAAKLAHAHEFIMEMKDGYQTLIGERGVRLSGGQRQRLAIARALFANPKILIMDEPTSHLDTLSESLIQRALEDISRERSMTKIIIAHRLSTVQRADQILVMDRGALVEKGTHSELLAKNGVYAAIVRQSELKG